MKKRISILLLAALMLSACSAQSAPGAPANTGDSTAASSENTADTAGTELSAPPAESAAEPNTDPETAEGEFYIEKYYPFPEGVIADGVARIDSTLFMYCTSTGEEYFALADYTVDDTGRAHVGEARIIERDEPENIAEKNIYAICAGADGYFYAVTGETAPTYMDGNQICENPDYQGRYALLKYTADGVLMDKRELSLPDYPHVSSVAADKEGRVIICGGEHILCLEADGTSKSAALENRGYIYNGAVFGEQVIFEAHYAETYNDYEFLAYSPETGELTHFVIYNEDKTEQKPCEAVFANIQGLNGEYIFSDMFSYYSCEPDENVCHELFRWNYEGYPNRSCYVCRLSEKSVIRSAPGENYFVLSGMAQRAGTERSDVKVALYDVEQSGAENELALLNAQGTEYEYTAEKYRADELDRLLADLRSDTPPDLLIFSGGINTATDEFVDLYPFIDTDAELSRESFIPNFLDALTVKGELHELWPSTAVNTLVAMEAELEARGGESAVTNAEKCAALFRQMPEDAYLNLLAILGVSGFVDRDNGICSFDSPAFSEMLTCYADIRGGSSGADSSALRLSPTTVSSSYLLQGIRERSGEAYVFVGLPLPEGSGSFFSNVNQYSLAIPAASRCKDGAWAYIRAQLVESAQKHTNWGLPVNLAAFEHMAETKLTEENAALLTELVNNTKCAINYGDMALREIIMDCGSAYLAGEATLEKSVKLIQQRASEYLAEQYG